MFLKKILSLVLSPFSWLLRKIAPLHLGLYFLFSFSVIFGGFTAGYLETSSMIDVEGLRTEWTRGLDNYKRGEKVDFDADKVVRPLKRVKTPMLKAGDGDFRIAEEKKSSDERLMWYLLFIVPWLWPLYRHYFSGRKPPQSLVERRIINLPLFLFGLSWAAAIHRYFLGMSSYAELYGPVPDSMRLVFIASTVMMGAFASYLNIEITGAYVRRYIARPFFLETDPHGLKHGFAVNLTLRYGLMLFSLAAVPLLLCLYIPIFTSLDLFMPVIEAARNGDAPPLDYGVVRALLPLVFMAVLAVIILFFQFLSFLFYRQNVQAPISALVRRMKAVAAGDFSCKTSVFYTDELGQLKGHFNMMLDGLVERDHIKDTFGRYVSIEIAEKIMKSGKVNLAGEEIQATVLFSDIRDFTPLSERLPPAELIKFLNDYFSHVTAPIMANRGVINKFIGDAVMAIFSPVFGVEDHRAAGLRAALGMREALARFNAEGKYPAVEFGVGLHSGGLVAGNVGTEARLEYTVLGDTVNVASRIESQTRAAGAQILLSRAVMDGVRPEDFPGVKFTPGQPVLMKGKSEPLTLYTVA
ncbi:MAG: adenylate/guanylate cyclase domain-containing protein [Elusimicrobiales bacterium]|nr:adenylate/guanylate cyclase domain-containing protein [Elusimicrobiales bacterium]